MAETMAIMTDREKQILETFADIIPKLSNDDKNYLLGLGDGMTFKFEMQQKKLVQDGIR